MTYKCQAAMAKGVPNPAQKKAAILMAKKGELSTPVGMVYTVPQQISKRCSAAVNTVEPDRRAGLTLPTTFSKWTFLAWVLPTEGAILEAVRRVDRARRDMTKVLD